MEEKIFFVLKVNIHTYSQVPHSIFALAFIIVKVVSKKQQRYFITNRFVFLFQINDMKKTLTLFFICAAVIAQAQPKVVSQAMVTTKTTIISPDGDDDGGAPPPPPAPDGAEVRTFRFGGDGETKSVTTLKGDFVKTFTENEMSRTTVIRDNAKKVTTTIMEMMGRKNGFYATDEDQEDMRKRMDSMIQTRPQQGVNNNTGMQVVSTDIGYNDETKKIAGLQCKKAFLISTRQNGTKDSAVIWYCPDFKLQGVASTGGQAASFGFSFGNRNNSLSALSNLNGFPMQYEMKMQRGRKMIVEVTKVVLDKEIADKEFDIPKDVTLKSAKDMQDGNGRMQIRIGGPGGQ